MFYNHKEHKDVIMLGGHNVYDNENKKSKACENENYELLSNNKDIQKIHIIKLDEEKVYDIYLKYNIKTVSC